MCSKPQIKLLIDVARGMQYLHAHTPVILHRDLKPASVLIETAVEPPRAKLGEFRLSVMERGSGHTQRVGTPAYMAPEVQCSQHYSTSADVYSFGCVLLFSLTGDHPTVSLLPAVCTKVGSKSDNGDLAPIVRMMCRCLENAPQDRPDFSWLL